MSKITLNQDTMLLFRTLQQTGAKKIFINNMYNEYGGTFQITDGTLTGVNISMKIEQRPNEHMKEYAYCPVIDRDASLYEFHTHPGRRERFGVYLEYPSGFDLYNFALCPGNFGAFIFSTEGFYFIRKIDVDKPKRPFDPPYIDKYEAYLRQYEDSVLPILERYRKVEDVPIDVLNRYIQQGLEFINEELRPRNMKMEFFPVYWDEEHKIFRYPELDIII